MEYRKCLDTDSSGATYIIAPGCGIDRYFLWTFPQCTFAKRIYAKQMNHTAFSKSSIPCSDDLHIVSREHQIKVASASYDLLLSMCVKLRHHSKVASGVVDYQRTA